MARSWIMVVGMAAMGCASVRASQPVQTIDAVTMARDLVDNAQTYRGRMIRVCGAATFERWRDSEWILAMPRASGYHPAEVHVLSCGQVRPRRDSEGCITGRIARRDGSLTPLAPDEPRIVSSSIVSYEWFLHARCPSGR